jgi:hypothetical protein
VKLEQNNLTAVSKKHTHSEPGYQYKLMTIKQVYQF